MGLLRFSMRVWSLAPGKDRAGTLAPECEEGDEKKGRKETEAENEYIIVQLARFFST